MLIECRAKINTFLAVGPPDRRGWHPLRTIFQEIDLADTLAITPNEGDHDVVTFSVEGIPDENTVTKTLHALRQQGEEIPPLRIHVKKVIPSEAGLGGGSSNAAALIRHFGADMARETQWFMARAIGADVPFFLYGGRAKGTEHGDFITPLPDLPPCPLVLAQPDERCATPEMFRQLDERPREFRAFPDGDALYNDFERVAPCASLELIDRLRSHGAKDAGLTGSGSVVFGRFEDEIKADQAAEAMRREAPWVARAATVSSTKASSLA